MLSAAWNLAGARMPGIVGEHNDIAGEEGRVGAAQVQQHAVVARNRNHPHAGYTRRGSEFPIARHHGEYRRVISLRKACHRRGPSRVLPGEALGRRDFCQGHFSSCSPPL